MSEFQFVKSQRVIVPTVLAGAAGVQAVVTAVTGFVGREPEYELQWPACDMADAHGRLVPCSAKASESMLMQAQPILVVTIAEAEEMVAAARGELGLDIARLEATARRRQKAARTRSRKRR